MCFSTFRLTYFIFGLFTCFLSIPLLLAIPAPKLSIPRYMGLWPCIADHSTYQETQKRLYLPQDSLLRRPSWEHLCPEAHCLRGPLETVSACGYTTLETSKKGSLCLWFHCWRKPRQIYSASSFHERLWCL